MSNADIPKQIWILILEYLDELSLCAAESACKLFRDISRENHVWKDLQIRRTFTFEGIRCPYLEDTLKTE